ncbi:MAG: endopeptidase La [Planctomycetota bacterium]|jgi:ATP-dependent Lon protease|nr:endopeptidase La [Planctomycetota bacterium]
MFQESDDDNLGGGAPERPENPESTENPVVPVVPVEPERKTRVPDILPVLPLRDAILFPDMLLTYVIQDARDIRLVDDVLLQDRFVAFVPVVRPQPDENDPSALWDKGCAGVILKMIKFPDGGVRLLVQGLKRIRIETILQRQPYFSARTSEIPDAVKPGVALDALHRSVRDQFNRLLGLLSHVPNEVKLSAINIAEPGRFADLVTANLNLAIEERCSILEAADVGTRLERISLLLEREMQIVELGAKIHEDVKQKINQGQREFFLREQLRAIRRELGERDDDRPEAAELEKAIEAAGLPEEAMKEAKRELSRLGRMQPGSAEYTVSRTYLDWMASLPWNVLTEDCLDMEKARKILDADHYDLDKVKNRIIEYLAVRKVHPAGRSPILCFVGPPGVGKTSLGRSIAKAMGRKFERISLGGVRDEAEIRGHRRTYVGALPGRIIQGMRRAGSRNPVFMLDEIDKLVSDMHGDPSSALLEVLDTEQNLNFRDHYLDAPFDLSKVVFITTANTLEPVPPALLDRMEVLRLAGYSSEEKLRISRRHLLPKVLAEHGVPARKAVFDRSALATVINSYTREAGLRNLEREFSSIVRKIAVKMANGKRGPFRMSAKDVKSYLGPPSFFAAVPARAETPGVALGLAWTAVGGDLLYIEATAMPGKKGLLLTGRLGDVIKESAQAALSWIRTRGGKLGLKDGYFEEHDIHVHFPEGATPKDGPSAGITLVAALVSLFTGTPIRSRLAMTGEITLRGKILPVGGIKEKMLAARRADVRDVIIPAGNVNDLDEIQPEVRRAMTFHPIERIEEMLPVAFPGLADKLDLTNNRRLPPARKVKFAKAAGGTRPQAGKDLPGGRAAKGGKKNGGGAWK